MTFDQFSTFHDFSMSIFIFQVFQSLWEPCSWYLPLKSECPPLPGLPTPSPNTPGPSAWDVMHASCLRQSASRGRPMSGWSLGSGPPAYTHPSPTERRLPAPKHSSPPRDGLYFCSCWTALIPKVARCFSQHLSSLLHKMANSPSEDGPLLLQGGPFSFARWLAYLEKSGMPSSLKWSVSHFKVGDSSNVACSTP